MYREQLLYLVSSVCTRIVNHVRNVPKSFDKILLIKLDEIGDMIYTLHALKAVRQFHPESEITICCKEVNATLLKNEGVTDHTVHSLSGLNRDFDLIIDLRGNWKSLGLSLLNSKAYRLDRGTIRIKNKLNGKQLHEVYTNWEVIKPILPDNAPFHFPKMTTTKDTKNSTGSKLSKLRVDKFVVMHCGARDVARRWPADRFSKICDFINKTYHLPVLLVGSESEKDLTEEVKLKSIDGKVINIAGSTSLLELAEICNKSEFFVGNESGPLHFAVIAQKPLVAIFGPGVKDVFYPLYEHQKVIHKFLSKGHYNQTAENSSILQVTEEEVQQAILEVCPPTSIAGE